MSVWHTPVATIRTRTSSCRGSSRSRFSKCNGADLARATAALIFISLPPERRACAKAVAANANFSASSDATIRATLIVDAHSISDNVHKRLAYLQGSSTETFIGIGIYRWTALHFCLGRNVSQEKTRFVGEALMRDAPISFCSSN